MPRKKMACSTLTIQKRVGKLKTVENAFEAYKASTRYREKHHKMPRKFKNYSKIRKCSNYPSIRRARNRREYKLLHQMLWQFAIAMKINKQNPNGYEYAFIGAFEAWLRYYMSRKDFKITDFKLFKGECCRLYENESMEKFQSDELVQNCSVCNPTYSKYSISHSDTQVLHLHHCWKGLEVENYTDSEPDTEPDSDSSVTDSDLSDSLLDEEATEV